MLLSIIISNYPLPQELLKRCIDSVLATGIQAEEYEMVVGDDGSAEPPVWIKEKYPFSNIRLLECEHGGLGSARNNGIDAAEGRYIIFLDGDDTLHTGNALQPCLDRLKQDRPDILRFRFRYIAEGQPADNRKKQKVHFGNTISGAAYMANGNLPGSSCCYFIRKEFIENKGISFTPHIYHEDEEFTTMAHFHAQTLIDSDAIIYNYHIRENSITRSKSPADIAKREADHLAVIKRLCKFRGDTLEHSNSIQRRALHRKLTMLAVDYIINSINNGKSIKEIHRTCNEELASVALYPFIKHGYGIKYNIFHKLANSTTGLRILRLLLPSPPKAGKQ